MYIFFLKKKLKKKIKKKKKKRYNIKNIYVLFRNMKK